MAKFITDYLDKYSRAITNHESWAYLDCMSTSEQLDVIKNYTDTKKYIVVVFTHDEQAVKHFKRAFNLGVTKHGEEKL